MGRGNGAAPFAAGAIIAKKYRLLRCLGEGSLGVVWEAVELSTGLPVALKLIVRPGLELRRRLLGEAPAWARIRHENIAALLDFGETGCGDPFLVTERLEGETLASALAREGRFAQQEAARIGRGVALALVAVHEQGLVHRALRPTNIFLHDPSGAGTPVVKVLDVGMSRDAVGPGGSPAPSGAPLPSPWTMSPEQVWVDATIDGRSDVWSLGAVLYEMFAGARPFEGEAAAVLQQIVTVEPAPLWHLARKLHPAVAGLVMACLRRRREERPWPVQEIALRLEPFAAGCRGSLPPLAIPLAPPSAPAGELPPASR